ncbi:MCE family protein [Mycolicibacterium arenosum]|uniref:MCE family protein n=1 Tax=Mycolicibacterium arenosum TaxID=2952157 RepID=A0ABT1M5C9_9MYCO|nr:MlaD family protein [Mycolicibacterium sp. CAU 1645]MCP9272997.1 MCE family protein [Mycolicibacterium sp. CAU 1645]
MLSRLVRIQLVLFTIASVIGVVTMAVVYVQVPTLLGIGRITVTLQMPAAGGLYPFSNVTYRGVNVGKVTEIRTVGGRSVEAELSLDTSPPIPVNLTARVRSVSAVGEQYVDLQPVDDAPPYLENGSVIPADRTALPEPVGPMLDKLNALVGSFPKDKLGPLLDEGFKAFNGAGYDFGSLLDSTTTLTRDLDGVADQSRALIDDSGPLLESQAQTTDSLAVWARSMAGITDQLVAHDDQFRALLQNGPGFAREVTTLLEQVKPTLPVLLANLTSIGQVLVTYNKSLEQLLVLFPPYLAGLQSVTPANNPTGKPLGDFAVSINDPPSCTVGFLPPSQWRSPADTTEMDTPDGIYCKLPQDAPIAVRGARNYPCVEHPGKRAATVQDCNSDKPFQPLAMRQHVLGPYPIDPNLISQGIPPDGRVDSGERLYAPVEGTGPPPGPPAEPAAAPPPPGGPQPAVGFAQYNPQTGAYMGPDGKFYHQTDLATPTAPESWTELMPGPN